MRSIYGEELGNTIDFRSVGAYTMTHPWPPETAVSAGRGVVLRSRSGEEPYVTLFMEAYPPGASFIRGEGETPAECENAAWAKYQVALHCPATEDGAHDWEPRGYVNGAGFCRHCNTFRAGCFTGEELGQFCVVCGVGTTYSNRATDDGSREFFCEEHSPAPELPEWLSGLHEE